MFFSVTPCVCFWSATLTVSGQLVIQYASKTLYYVVFDFIYLFIFALTLILTYQWYCNSLLMFAIEFVDFDLILTRVRQTKDRLPPAQEPVLYNTYQWSDFGASILLMSKKFLGS